MELIKSTNNITGTVPKIVETHKHFSLNTQIYNKLSFKPYPMKFFTRNIGPFLSLYTSINRVYNHFEVNKYTTDSLYNNEHNQINIIHDKNDENIFYAIRPYIYESSESVIIEKVQYNEVTMEYNVLNTINISTVLEKSRTCVKTLYDNENVLVLFACGKDASYAASAKTMVYIIDKKTFSGTPIFSTADQYDFLFKVVNDDLYILRIATVSTVNVKFYINKLNINTKAYTQIYEYTEMDSTMSKRTVCNPVQIGEDFYMLYTASQDSSYFYKIMKTSISADDTVTTEVFDIDLNGFILDDTGILDTTNNFYYTLRKIETNSGLYLSLLIHLDSNSTTAAYYRRCKHALIKVENDTFRVVDVVDLKDGCFGSLEYIDPKHQIYFTSNSVLFYSFNSTEEKMEITHKHSGIYTQIGFDSLNRLILNAQSGSVEIITEGNASTLKADFAEEVYNKDQSGNLESTVSFYAKNFLDEYVDINVKLTLIGPVVFKENNSQELIISSSETGIKSVPVVINGYGTIEVIITQNT